MATTYIKRDTTTTEGAHGLTNVIHVVEMNRDAAGTSANLAFSIPFTTTHIALFVAHDTNGGATEPGADGGSGSQSFGPTEVRIVTGSTSIEVTVARHRANGGVLQSSSGTALEQTAIAGILTFAAQTPDLGTWATGDYYLIEVRLRNTATHGANIAIDIGTNTTDDEDVTPWTLAGAALVQVISESMQLVDSTERTLALLRIANEQVTLAETVTRARVLLRVLNEQVQALETTLHVLAAALVQVVNETVQLPETVANLRALVRSVQEQVEVGESVLRALAIIRTQNETVQTSEAIARALTMARVQNEQVTIPETVNRAMVLVREVVESLQLLETTLHVISTEAGEALVRIINESVQLPEAITNLRDLVRLVQEQIEVGDATLRALEIIRTQNEAVQLGEAGLRSLEIARVQNEPVSVVESGLQSLAALLVQIVNETVNVVEATARSLVKKVIAAARLVPIWFWKAWPSIRRRLPRSR